MTILLAWLFADLISGIVHWWEDQALGNTSRYVFMTAVIQDNDRHHKLPGHMVRLSWWGNINTTAPMAWTLSAVLFTLGLPTIVWLGVFFSGFGNLVHRWAHDPKRPRIVTCLQKIGFFISPESHRLHHFLDGKTLSRYKTKLRFCAMTNWLNPILDKVRFFELLTYLFGSKDERI